MSDSSTVIVSAGVAGSSAVVSFAVKTLPVVQWLAAATAIMSGLIGIAWVVYQYLQRRK